MRIVSFLYNSSSGLGKESDNEKKGEVAEALGRWSEDSSQEDVSFSVGTGLTKCYLHLEKVNLVHLLTARVWRI